MWLAIHRSGTRLLMSCSLLTLNHFFLPSPTCQQLIKLFYTVRRTDTLWYYKPMSYKAARHVGQIWRQLPTCHAVGGKQASIQASHYTCTLISHSDAQAAQQWCDTASLVQHFHRFIKLIFSLWLMMISHVLVELVVLYFYKSKL